MGEQDEFGRPDREGFEQLLAEPFVEYRGMLFRKSSFDPAFIDRRLETLGREEVQRELNHTHLFLYAADPQIQRRWAQELEQVWSRRFTVELPTLKVRTERKDSGQEVVLSFWVGG